MCAAVHDDGGGVSIVFYLNLYIFLGLCSANLFLCDLDQHPCKL